MIQANNLGLKLKLRGIVVILEIFNPKEMEDNSETSPMGLSSFPALPLPLPYETSTDFKK